MIVSASRRTDLPALYAPWFRRRIEAGFCRVPNPWNAKQVGRVSLRPEDVDAIVFWTRHPRPMFDSLDLLDDLGFRYYFQYTITGYGPPVEPRSPAVATAVATFRDLAARLGPGRVVWRYDPVLVGKAFPDDEHIARFGSIARGLAGHCRRVVISLLHPYRKTERRLGRLYQWGDDLAPEPAAEPGVTALLRAFAGIAASSGMRVEMCASPEDWTHAGIGKTKCIDDGLLHELFGGTWTSRKDPGQRPDCGCIPSKDIGVPDTCTLGCAYCYATRSDALGRRRRREHDAGRESLWEAVRV